jgi:WD40 repeat protein
MTRWDALTGEFLSVDEKAPTVWSLTSGELNDGRVVIYGAGHDEKVVRWDAATGERLDPPLVGHESSVRAVATAELPKGEGILVSGDEWGIIRKWKRNTDDQVDPPIVAHGDSIWNLVSIPVADGRTVIVSGSMDGEIRRWDAATGSPIGSVLNVDEESISSMAMMRLGEMAFFLASVNDRQILCWDVLSGDLVYSTDGTKVAAMGECGGVVLAIGTADGDIVVRHLVSP